MSFMNQELSKDSLEPSLSDYDCDLGIIINGNEASTPCTTGFTRMWYGARANMCVTQGSCWFECTVKGKVEVETEKDLEWGCRVGWSTSSAVLGLGEDEEGFGYDSTGKKVHQNKFSTYGTPFSNRDTVGCFIDCEAGTIYFTKNGKHLGLAFTIPIKEGSCFFPHILLKNVVCSISFGSSLNPSPEPSLSLDTLDPTSMLCHYEEGDSCPESSEECELLIMIGLPCSGKSTWAKNYIKQNPKQHYNTLAVNVLINRMKADEATPHFVQTMSDLSNCALSCFHQLLRMAMEKLRNYIIIQPNLTSEERNNITVPFEGWRKIAVVCVPPDHEYKKYMAKAEFEEGKYISQDSLMFMKANFELPDINDFEEIHYIGGSREEIMHLVAQYNSEGSQYLKQKKILSCPNTLPRWRTKFELIRSKSLHTLEYESIPNFPLLSHESPPPMEYQELTETESELFCPKIIKKKKSPSYYVISSVNEINSSDSDKNLPVTFNFR